MNEEAVGSLIAAGGSNHDVGEEDAVLPDAAIRSRLGSGIQPETVALGLQLAARGKSGHDCQKQRPGPPPHEPALTFCRCRR